MLKQKLLRTSLETQQCMVKRPNIVFMGTPDFAVSSLLRVHETFGVKAVVTVPDAPAGRGRGLRSSDVKVAALQLGIPVYQPESLKDSDFLEQMRVLAPDIFVVVAFRILPEVLFSMPSMASFNIHGSLLPKYRGAAPINWAIIRGEKETGVTSFVLNKGVDTGNIIAKKSLALEPQDTFGEVYGKLKHLGAELAVETIRTLCSEHPLTLEVQDNALATSAPKLFREQCGIDFSQTAESVHNFIRGLSPIPCAWTTMAGKRIKVFRSTVLDTAELEPGHFHISDEGFRVGTSTQDIKLLEIQPPNKKRMQGSDFVRGYRGEPTGVLS